MNPFESPAFFLAAAVLAVPAIGLGLAQKPLRHWTLASSLVMAALYGLWFPVQGAWLLGTVVWFLALARGHLAFRRRAGARHGWEKKAAVVLALAPLAAVKLAGPVGLGTIGFLGVSYITFRLVQVVVETSDGLITALPLGQTLSFLIFFPSLSSGPIDRSRRFAVDAATTWTRAEYVELLKVGLSRFVLGFFYKFVVAALFAVWLKSLPRDAHLVAMYAYGGDLFFDFAGYSLMAVGLGMVFGVRTPMNFRLPFVAESIKDFWQRWHITLSFWLRDYVYTRLLMALLKRTKLGPEHGNRIALMVNMLVMGAWHGLEAHYLMYGAYHGVLMVLTDWWQKKSGFHSRHHKATWYRVVSIVVTAHLVLFGFLVFSGRLTARS